MELRILESYRDEVNKGWFRINVNNRIIANFKREHLVKITVDKKSIYRIALGDDTIMGQIRLDRYSKDKLGVKNNEKYNFEFIDVNNSVWRQMKFYIQ